MQYNSSHSRLHHRGSKMLEAILHKIAMFERDIAQQILTIEATGFKTEDLVAYTVAQSNLRGQLGAVQQLAEEIKRMAYGDADDDVDNPLDSEN